MKIYLGAFILFFLVGFGLFYGLRQAASDTAETIEETIAPAPSLEPIPTPQDSLNSWWKTEELIDTFEYTRAGEFLNINWKMLARVKFEERYTEEIDAYVPYPKFHPAIQALDGEKVQLKGYIIPIEETGDENMLVLSANPFSSCFFCGMAGPETIMDIQLKAKLKKRLKQDDVLIFRGKLKLNDSDLYYLNYMLEEAELVD